MFRLTIPALLVIATPAFVAAQQGSAQVGASGSAALSTPAVEASTTGDAAADARIADAFADVAAEGGSTASLASRVQLGLARGVEPARIAAAVEQRAQALVSAGRTLRASGAAHSAATVELAGDAIESGANASQVAQVVAGFDGTEHTRALAALGVLAAEGRIGADVIATVRSAVAGGVGAEAAARANSADGAATAVSGGANAAVNAAGAASGVTGSAGATVRGALPR